jgi:hypothetical protein
MGYGIEAFSVRLSRVQRAFGSRDASLVSEITWEFDSYFEPDVFHDEGPTLEVALHEIIEGKPMQESYGHQYARILKLLCWHFGKYLPNSHFSAMRSEWAKRVDEGLVRAGVPPETFSLWRHLMNRGSPIAIPQPEDWPFIGYLKAAEIGPALRAVKAADLTVLDAQVRDAVGELRGWLEVCSKAVWDLVCFYN